MAVMRRAAKAKDYEAAHHRSGGQLQVPRTPTQKIMLEVRRIRLKREAEERRRAD